MYLGTVGAKGGDRQILGMSPQKNRKKKTYRGEGLAMVKRGSEDTVKNKTGLIQGKDTPFKGGLPATGGKATGAFAKKKHRKLMFPERLLKKFAVPKNVPGFLHKKGDAKVAWK